MDNFYVLGSNLSFPTSPPGSMTGSGYQLCGRYSGRPPSGALSKVMCQPQPITARFVYIQTNGSAYPLHLAMCEVWVYGSKYINKMNSWGSIKFLITRLAKARMRSGVEIFVWLWNWHAFWWYCCREDCKISERLEKNLISNLVLREVARSYDKTSYAILNRSLCCSLDKTYHPALLMVISTLRW